MVRRRPLPWVWVAAGLIIVLGIAFLVFYDVSSQTKASPLPEENADTSLPGQFFPSQGNNHLAPGETFSDYDSNPPTSGPHAPETVPWGIYDAPVPKERLVHDMEHGGVIIWYNCPGCDELIQQLKDLVSPYLGQGGVVLVPYPTMDAEIALTSWTRLLKLDQFDEGQIKEFITVHLGRYDPEGIWGPKKGKLSESHQDHQD
ncbi:MAG: DUF3105 domain-containing protein [Chloroflexi bacterium]|nr:DUF3105 domain-containing protein [Chloroflexota bacterium]